MKKAVLIAAVLLVCASTGFSQPAVTGYDYLVCMAKASINVVQDMYALVKNKKPEYESRVVSFVKKSSANNYQNFINNDDLQEEFSALFKMIFQLAIDAAENDASMESKILKVMVKFDEGINKGVCL